MLSTLIIAVLFSPARNRNQEMIAGQFYRARYNGQQTLSRFIIIAQDEVDPEQLKKQLINIVQDTLRPENIML